MCREILALVRWCLCLVAVTMQLLFLGLTIIPFLLHQEETSFKLSCSDDSIDVILFPDIYRDVSSAKRSFVILLLDMFSGRSFMKIQKSNGPNIDPWGKPVLITPFFRPFVAYRNILRSIL